ncbi:MAG: hypothetical protein M3N24_01105 [Actinomycetota bacterium]|nr:hypothetical protein [Actinomycetota bacterium]
MRVLGLLIATGGGVAIGFGWAGAAQVSCVDCQIPFLLSGGAAGLGLIIFGISLLLLAQIRTESRRLGDRIEHALGVRPRAAEPQAPPATATEQTPKKEDTPPAPAVGDARPTPSPEETEPRPEEPALSSPEPAPNPLSAVPVDAPAAESEARNSDAATVAATTVAGGVVDTEDESGTTEPEKALDETAGEASRPGAVSIPPPQAEGSPEMLGRRSDAPKRRGLFRRRKGP